MSRGFVIDDSYDGLLQDLDRVGPSPARVERGGPGSGHFGHEGRPGQRGGSAPGGDTSISEYRQPREPEEPPTGGRRWNPTISITKTGEVRKFVASKMSEALGRPITVRTGKVEEMYDYVRGQSPHGVVFTDDRGNGLLLQAADGGAYGFDPYKIAIGGVWTFKVGEPTYKRDEQGKPIFQEGVPGSGSGLGTAMFNALKEYVDAAGKELEVYSIANQRFFSQERFPWMVGERGDLSREYVSPILKAEREARSAAG